VKNKVLLAGLILLCLLEISGVYFIMPFPGSQQMASLPFAYWIHNNKWWLRLLLLLPVLYFVFINFRSSKTIGKVMLSAALIIYGFIFYVANFRLQADTMFLQPQTKAFAKVDANVVDPGRLVLGVVSGGIAKAYPIQVIGYHHQVRDTIGNTPVMITYCTVCRTGRVFSPEVEGRPESFRLVGMDHFNAMFEDATTKSWWQQATGMAVAGKLKGKALKELPFTQSSLRSWVARYPNTLILQPDTVFHKQYASLKDFDNGTTKDELEKRDSSSWKFKSWVIGVEYSQHAKAYDWNQLITERLIQDSLAGTPLMITLESDTATFHVLSRRNKGQVLDFQQFPDNRLTDLQTSSTWNFDGSCIEGPLKGERLSTLKSSQEFWHSWQTFHPASLRYEK